MITVLTLFVFNTVFVLFSPPLNLPVNFKFPTHWGTWSAFYYIVWYFFGAVFSFTVFQLKDELEDKFWSFAACVYLVGMIIFNGFLINSESIFYVEKCNSKTIALEISIFLWALSYLAFILSFGIPKYLRQILKFSTKLFSLWRRFSKNLFG